MVFGGVITLQAHLYSGVGSSCTKGCITCKTDNLKAGVGYLPVDITTHNYFSLCTLGIYQEERCPLYADGLYSGFCTLRKAPNVLGC